MHTFLDDENTIFAEVNLDKVLLEMKNEDNIEQTIILTIEQFNNLVKYVNKQLED